MRQAQRRRHKFSPPIRSVQLGHRHAVPRVSVEAGFTWNRPRATQPAVKVREYNQGSGARSQQSTSPSSTGNSAGAGESRRDKWFIESMYKTVINAVNMFKRSMYRFDLNADQERIVDELARIFQEKAKQILNAESNSEARALGRLMAMRVIQVMKNMEKVYRNNGVFAKGSGECRYTSTPVPYPAKSCSAVKICADAKGVPYAKTEAVPRDKCASKPVKERIGGPRTQPPKRGTLGRRHGFVRAL